jgi:hypothetical protein
MNKKQSIWKKTDKDGFPIFEHTEHPTNGICPNTHKQFTAKSGYESYPAMFRPIGGPLHCSECGDPIHC